jgi:hypothetical protein
MMTTFRAGQVTSAGAELALVDRALADPERGIGHRLCRDTNLDQFLALTSGRTDRSMTFTNANANLVVAGKGRLV